MQTKNRRRTVWLLLSIGLGCFLLLLGSLSRPTYAAPLALPTRAAPAGTGGGTGEGVGSISLHVVGQNDSWESLWAEVEWQDGIGDWHVVEAWRGTIDRLGDEEGWKDHLVLSRDFGTGPFRWIVYQAQEGKMLAVSESFRLPHADQVVHVEIALGAEAPLLPVSGDRSSGQLMLFLGGSLILLGMALWIAGHREVETPVDWDC